MYYKRMHKYVINLAVVAIILNQVVCLDIAPSKQNVVISKKTNVSDSTVVVRKPIKHMNGLKNV